MTFPVHPESATTIFHFFSCMYLWLAPESDCYKHMYFKFNCILYQYRLMYHAYDHIHCFYFIISLICVPYCFVIIQLDCIAQPTFWAQIFFLCISPIFVGSLYHTYQTSSKFIEIWFLLWISWSLGFLFFFVCIWMYSLFLSFTSVVCVTTNTLRLQNSACSD